MIKRIVISGGWSYGNLGDEVIAKCTIDLLDRYFPNIEKNYTSYDVGNFKVMHNITAIESVHSVFDRQGYGLNEIDACVANPERYEIKDFADLFDSNTLFIMSGGGYFDGRWYNQFAARIVEMKIANMAKAKTAIIGQSIGPLINHQERELLKGVLEKCDFVNVRDVESRCLLHEILPEKEVSCTSDIAITISDLLCDCSEKDKKRCNLVVQIYTDYVNNGVKGEKNNTLYSKIRKRILLRQYRYDLAWVRLLRKIRKTNKYECNIVLNVQGTGKVKNLHFERYARKLKRLSGCDEINIVNCESVADFCKMLAGAELIISCKMHPLIVSSSYGVKTYALSQHYKIDAYMKWIGRESSCYRNDKFHPKKLVNQILSESDAVQEKSNKLVTLRKQEVYQMFDSLFELVYERK